MTFRRPPTPKNFPEIIRIAFLKTALVAAVISALGSFLISKILEGREQRNSEAILNRAVTELIVPALEISDFAEVKRVLGLLNRDSHLYGVRTLEGDILLEDDSEAHVFDSFAPTPFTPSKLIHTCSSDQESWRVQSVFCTPIYKVSQNGATREIRGLLLTSVVNSSVKKDLSRFLFLIGLSLFIFVMTSFLVVRRVIRTIVQPIQNLHLEVKSGFFSGVNQDRIKDTLPAELQDLRSAFGDFLEMKSQQTRLEVELARQSGLNHLAAQVAHDIRSPLAALNVAREDLLSLPEEVRMLILGAINRIESIAQQLLDKNRSQGFRQETCVMPTVSATVPTPMSARSLQILLSEIIAEKNLQHRGDDQLRIELLGQERVGSFFVKVVPQELMRVLSNLMNNSIEAMNRKGVIQLDVTPLHDHIRILVSDSGKGIPPEVLKRVGQRGLTHEKPGGSGLGLHHAIQSVRSWGGDVLVDSQVGQGTRVELFLPQVQSPEEPKKLLASQRG